MALHPAEMRRRFEGAFGNLGRAGVFCGNSMLATGLAEFTNIMKENI